MPFTFVNRDAVVTKIDVLHPKPRSLQNAQTTAVKQFGHQGIIAFEMSEDGAGFRFAENDGDSSGAANALNAGDKLELSIRALADKEKAER